MPDDDTTRVHRSSGALSAEERLERIENSIGKLDDKIDGKLDEIKQGLSDGSTRFATLDLTINSLTHRVERLEGARDMVVKMVMGTVLVALLALIGLKAFA